MFAKPEGSFHLYDGPEIPYINLRENYPAYSLKPRISNGDCSSKLRVRRIIFFDTCFEQMSDRRDRRHGGRDRNQRSRSPNRDRHHRSHRRRNKSPRGQLDQLPLGARPLSKHDLDSYRGLLGLYLDLQKQLDIDELSIDEVKGRWKSFYGKW